jgi:hypothetical protein
MRLRSCILVLLLLKLAWCHSQKEIQYHFHPPLEIPLSLAANFGDIRTNHFHMGVDFKTNGIEGLRIVAIEDGFVSRIKVSPYGYGKVIYIDHPNGLTSVYAHCSAFMGLIDSACLKQQFQEQHFEIDHLYKPGEIPVKKGEVIALSGNTGTSSAPHLHFEIRDTKTEFALNPLHYGFEISDHQSPEIKSLKVYALTEQGYQIPRSVKNVPVFKGKYGYYIGGDKLDLPATFCPKGSGIGFAFEVNDFMDGKSNFCGLYGSLLIIDSDTLFTQKTDCISFDHTRYVNNHKDYAEYNTSKRKFHKTYKTIHNPLFIYPKTTSGILTVRPGSSYKTNYQVFDTENNYSSLNFTLNILPGIQSITPHSFSHEKYFLPDSSYLFQSNEVVFSCKSNTFYEPVQKTVSLKKPYTFGDSNQPIQQAIHIKIKAAGIKPELLQHYYIAVNAQGKTHALSTTMENGWLTSESYYLGTFSLKCDTTPPVIKSFNFKETDTLLNISTLTWRVNEKETKIKDYTLYIDGQWQLLEFESKANILIFDNPTNICGKHQIKLVVTDNCGNQKIWFKELFFAE